jgi:two-component sensor histidine kinase
LRSRRLLFEVETRSDHPTAALPLPKTIRLYIKTAIIALVLFMGFACQKSGGARFKHSAEYRRDSALVMRYIAEGSRAYAQKSGYEAFAKSMMYFDSAWHLAARTGDSLLIAESMFAKGRAYDAWNHEPEQTIQHYATAAEYFEKHPGHFELSLYLKHLVAHAYEKQGDSTSTIRVLTELCGQIRKLPDSLRQELLFIPEMALISTQVGNYELAQTILTQYTKREWIRNDSLTYDYLHHSYLTRARLDVLAHRKSVSPWLDSLDLVYKNCKNLSNSSYYGDQLLQLFRVNGNTLKRTYYEAEFKKTDDAMSKDVAIMAMQKTLNDIEKGAVEKEVQLKREQLRQRTLFIQILSLLLALIAGLLLLTYRKNRQISRQKADLAATNAALNQKNLQNQLLNKELHHRVQNNLQLIMSLVYMQERKAKSHEARQHMENIKLRIESISKLHRQLSGQSTEFDLKPYFQSLVANVSNLVSDNRKIVTHLSVESMVVLQKIGFPLGLIINEWITNSVKHAQPDTNLLEIDIKIHTAPDRSIQVHYHDNGIKKPDFNPQKDPDSLGLSIITLLSDQLGAELITMPDHPFTYQLTIPFADHV